MKPFYVYMLRCGDGSYYTGQTDDMDLRLQQHDTGKIGYTATRKPVELIWQGEFEAREGAIAFEQQIKGWSRAKKEALMAGDWAQVKVLAKSKTSNRSELTVAGTPSTSSGRTDSVEHVQEPNISIHPERMPEPKLLVRSERMQEPKLPVRPERMQEPRLPVRPERMQEPKLPVRSERMQEPKLLVRSERMQEPKLPVRPELVEGSLPTSALNLSPSTSSGRTDSMEHVQEPNISIRPERMQEPKLPVRPELVEGSLPTSALNLSPSTSSGRTVSVEQVLGADKPGLQRRAIAKAITLLESTREDHRTQADQMLTALLPHTGKALRLGISGVPGVGKSTFIEVLGLNLIARGHRVAVLTIDPSSTVSGGSILGDKTRMEQLSVHERAYIRPSPSSGTLGGVAEKTREAMLVCEAAGYDVVIVETVGVGQSETAVANMTDMFVLMQLPNAGDDLQAIKKGVMELADLVVINKADIDADAAMRAQAQITSAMRLFGLVNNAMGKAQADVYDQHWHPQVLQLSALRNQGVDAFWTAVSRFRELQTANGMLAQRRQQQSLAWMWERIEAGLKTAFRQDPAVASLLPALAAQVASGQLPASSAARQLLAAHNKHAQRS
jgi:LAO/AO transport system kinase